MVLFLALAGLAAVQMPDLLGLVRGDRHQAEIRRLRDRMAELEEFRAQEAALQARLERAQSVLTEAAVSLLPDPADPYAWAVGQLHSLERVVGVRLGRVWSEEPPPIRIRRDQDPRRFHVYRCAADFSGTMGQSIAFVQAVERRNPYVVVSGLTVGPATEDDSTRQGSIILDWPAWASPALRAALTAGFSAAEE
jgi:hypothetical protein